jgi:hypothetical protein
VERVGAGEGEAQVRARRLALAIDLETRGVRRDAIPRGAAAIALAVLCTRFEREHEPLREVTAARLEAGFGLIEDANAGEDVALDGVHVDPDDTLPVRAILLGG